MRYFITALAFLICWSGCKKTEPVTACCSCTCVALDSGVCTGAKREARGEQTCEERCKSDCAERRCRLDQAAKINEGECEGGLVPFLGGAATIARP